jgi:hypothetical protein
MPLDQQAAFQRRVVELAEAAYKAADPPDNEGGAALTVTALQLALATTCHATGMSLDDALRGLGLAWDVVLQGVKEGSS